MSDSRLSRYGLAFAGLAGAAALLAWAGCQQTASLPAGAPAATAAAPAPGGPSGTMSTPAAAPAPAPKETAAVAQFKKVVEPILQEHCYDCHGEGASKGGVAFDELKPEGIAHDPSFWLKVLKNVRAHTMPPPSAENPLSPAEHTALQGWITTAAFGLDPAQPDPGRVTLHRLNRVEYKNTIRDLLGVEFETSAAFPDDDSGYGFDNIADVLNMSPLLMEKYLAAAQTIIDGAVPKIARRPALTVAGVGDFVYPDGTKSVGRNIGGSGIGAAGTPAIPLSFGKEAALTHTFDIKEPGEYRVVVEQNIRGGFGYVTQRAQVTITLDDRQMSQQEYGWAQNSHTEAVQTVRWEPGQHTIAFAIKPVIPEGAAPATGRGGGGGNDVIYNLKKVRVEGPLDPARWVHPPNYARFFPRDEVPVNPAERRAYAREILGKFATSAFRRPTAPDSIEPLVDIAEGYYKVPGTTFETGIAQAMTAVLSSPRFLYRVEAPAAAARGATVADIDEYSLASRLSYFLWSTMPDAELLKLAAEGKLRANIDAQVQRLLADKRSENFVEQFTGQWLQSRLVTTVPLNQREILAREGINVGGRGRPGGNTGPGSNVPEALRNAFKAETEKYFEHVLRENRSVDEFIASDYTFLNETSATAYKIEDVKGAELRKVTLPPGNERGGMLTMGSVLMITSNPTRTSPVKRGKWILENILDAPTPPPPPDIPALEDAKPKDADHPPTLRETMAIHRENALCASCHNRMDPLGLALENFNALGSWRTQEHNQPIDASGKLTTGEAFTDIRELKKILLDTQKTEYYRCLTEKLMIYALGRGTEYYDVPAVDKIVADLQKNNGSFSTLLMGVINSVPFQQQRLLNPSPAAQTAPRLTSAEQ